MNINVEVDLSPPVVHGEGGKYNSDWQGIMLAGTVRQQTNLLVS
jgi:hypothetical protein